MKIFETSSINQSQIIPNIFLFGITLIGFTGFLDSVYLTAKRFVGGPIPCFVFTGCDTVAQSPYALLFGVPLSALGIFYYLSVLLLAIFYFETKQQGAMKLFSVFSVVGFLASVYFVYLQAFVIKAFCFYCLLSAVTSTTLFILGATIWFQYFREKRDVI